jgi:hypothetical protein
VTALSQTAYPKLDFTYQVDFNDLFSASALLASRRYPAGHRLRLNLIIVGVMVLGGIFSATAGVVVQMLMPAVPGWAATVALLVLIWLFYAKMLVPWITRQSARMINAAYHAGQMHFSSDAEGLRWQDVNIDFLLRWNGIEAIFRTPTTLAFMSGVIALVLPLSAFPDQETLRRFLEQALERMPPQAAELSRKDPSLQALLLP